MINTANTKSGNNFSLPYRAEEMKELTRNFNWANTSVGGIELWPTSLKTMVNLLLSSSYPMVLFWGDEQVQFYNDAFREILGLNGKHPAALGQKAIECWPEIWSIIHPYIEKVSAGEFASFENQLLPIFRNGKIEDAYWTFAYSPVYNDKGLINGVLVICNETTDKIVSDKNISRQINNLFCDAPMAMCILRGKDYTIEMVNNQMALMWDRNVNEVLNKPVFEVLTELNGQGYKELLDNVYESGERFVTEELPISLQRNGKLEHLFIKFVYEPLRDEHGNISGVLSLVHEITDLVNAIKKTGYAEQKAMLAIDAAEMGVYEIDLVSMTLIGDLRFFELMGLKEDATLFEVLNLLSPEDLLKRQMAYKGASVTGKVSYEAKIIYTDKSVHWIKIRGKLFCNTSNQPLKMLGVISDITQQKLFEKQKDDFLSLASHELKTPITAIKAYGQLAELLLTNNGDLISLKLLKKMGVQVQKLTSLIDTLLDITKIQQGQLIFNEHDFDFDQFINRVIENMQEANPLHSIIVNLEAGKEIFGDQQRLEQVLRNLISNSVKYSMGTATILIQTKIHENGILLSVQDNGIGIIANENLIDIFKQFYKFENLTGLAGMGIGLYICTEIIKRQGGKIWVESLPDQGGTFNVWLPFDYRKSLLSLDDKL